MLAVFGGLTHGADDKGTGLVRIVMENKQLTAWEAWEKFQQKHPTITLMNIFEQGKLENFKDLALLDGIKDWVIQKNRRDYTMNVKIAFQLLGKVGTLMQIAYAGCKGYSCQVACAAVLSNYQDMVEESYATSNAFVQKAASAMNYHRYALKRLERGDAYKAFTYVSKSAKVANTMVTEAQKMVTLSDTLKQKAHDAFLKAVGDDVKNKKEIDEFKARLANATGSVNKINAMLAKNNALMQKAAEDARAAGEQAADWTRKHEEEAKRKIKTNEICKVTPVPVISLSIVTITRSVKTCYTKVDEADVKAQARALEGFEKGLKDARNRELEHLKAQREIEKSSRDLMGLLAKDISELDFTKTYGSQLERAKQSLEISIKTLAMVKTIFLKAVSFWTQVGRSAEARSDSGQMMEDFKDFGLDEPDEFEELLIESGMSWLALGSVCIEARTEMVQVVKQVTDSFIGLPNAEQAKKVIDTCKPILKETTDMIKQLGEVVNEKSKEIENGEKADQIEDKLTKPTTLLLE